MIESTSATTGLPPPAGAPTARERLRRLAISAGVLVLLFAVPLWHLVKFALGSSLYSHIVLIPVISAYLAWTRRKELRTDGSPARALAAILLAAGLALAAIYGAARFAGTRLDTEDRLALSTLAFVLLLVGLCSAFLPRTVVRTLAFPLGFLVFMAPLPVAVRASVESFLQYGSAAAAWVFFKLSGMPVFQHQLAFELPGFSLEVAPECSGIHSTLALLITSLVAAHLFLRPAWKKSALALAVIPLALLRNGFRVFVIGQLCVRIGPQMIDSPIHHQGGPIFFALSLIPFALLLWWLARSDRREPASPIPRQ